MGFSYSEETGLIHLYSKSLSYVMKVNSHLIVEHLYFGKRINDPSALKQEGGDNFQYYENGAFKNEGPYYPNISKNEFGSHLRMDLRPSSFVVSQKEDELTDFRFVSFSKTKHNEFGEDEPHVKNEEEATRVTLKLKDAYRSIYLYATYTLFKNEDVLVKSTRIVNKTRNAVRLEKICSSTLDFDFKGEHLIHFPGTWAKERQYCREPISYGSKVLYSLEGRSGHFENPFFVLCDSKADEWGGECYSFNLVYSGNFKNEIFLSSANKLRVNVGINDTGFSYLLKPKGEFQAPEVVIAYSPSGLNRLSQANHAFVKKHILPESANAPFPLLFNSWEGTGMDFNLESIKEYASAAKKIGAELFVLDDGWFSTRNDDRHGLGDWRVNKSKVDLAELSSYVHSLGMKFGIWIEPEMVNIDTELFKAHPDWIISHPGVEYEFSRNQLVLDFSQKEVRDYVLSSILSSLKGVEVDYIKYDMNRFLGDIYSPRTRQGELFDKNIKGVYAFMASLLKELPHIIFENCASGGGRFDLGMLYFSPLIWTSDNTNPLDRTYIQYGTSFGYPLSVISSHVSSAPAPYLDKANVAFLGSYGYEMNPLKLSEEEKTLLLRFNEAFREDHYSCVQEGAFFRLANPMVDGFLACMSLSKDKKKGYVLLSLTKDFEEGICLKIKGLKPGKTYSLGDKREKGSSLSEKGVSFPELKGKGQTKLLLIQER